MPDDVLATLAAPEAEARWEALTLQARRVILETLGMSVRILPTGRRGPGFDPNSVAFEWKS
jgi:hypothetical protein